MKLGDFVRGLIIGGGDANGAIVEAGGELGTIWGDIEGCYALRWTLGV